MLDLSHSTVKVWNNPNVFKCESCDATECSTCVSNGAILCLSCFEVAKKIADAGSVHSESRVGNEL